MADVMRTRRSLTLLFISFFLVFSFPTASHELKIIHCLKGCPTGTPPSNTLIVREIYALSSNKSTKFADWVAYQVTSETIGTSKSLNRDWEADPLLNEDETLEPGDYTGAFNELKTDRGHQAPLASFAGTIYWRTTNILSNITPQKSDLNQGPWVRLESAIRDAAYKRKLIYVLTGPLYDPLENQMTLPNADEPHQVPTGYWKVVATESGAMTAFIFDQDTERDADYCNHIETLDKIEQESGLDLFPEENTWPTGEISSLLGC